MVIAESAMIQDYHFNSFATRKRKAEIEATGEPTFSADMGFSVSHGLYLELKKEGTRLRKKNGEWANDHIAEQADTLDKLRQRGYCAEFAVGFEKAKKIIDEYLGGK